MRIVEVGDTARGPVRGIRIGSEPGPVLEVLDLGATVHRLWVTDRDGVRRNVVLGHPEPQEYLDSRDYVGGTVGRYANRIAGSRFALDGRTVRLDPNERGNHLHGGPDGFDKRPWELLDAGDEAVALRLVSPDGDQGYPGRLVATARFEVRADTVRLELEAVTDAPTVVNLTSHAYWDLDGDGVTAHRLRVDADGYVEVDGAGLPGEVRPVEGTRLDLRRSEGVGPAPGLDHTLVARGQGWRRVATLVAPRTGLRMDLSTDQPGLQVYTGGGFDGSRRSPTGAPYGPGAGVALEPQLFPDTPNRPEFGSAVLRPGETYRSVSEWRFSTGG